MSRRGRQFTSATRRGAECEARHWKGTLGGLREQESRQPGVEDRIVTPATASELPKRGIQSSEYR